MSTPAERERARQWANHTRRLEEAAERMRIPDTPLGPTPDYPARPSHPDFARLCEIVLELDSQAREAAGIPSIVTEIVDGPSLIYVALTRGLRAAQASGASPVIMAGVYLEAFVAGYRYHQRYGEGLR